MVDTSTEFPSATELPQLHVVVASTLFDARPERDLLEREVLPELRRMAGERSLRVMFEFQTLALPLGAATAHYAAAALAEIEHHRPMFIAIVSDRYRLLEGSDASTLEELAITAPWLADIARGADDLAEIGIIEGVLSDPLMEGRSFFYFRDAVPHAADSGLGNTALDERLVRLREAILERGQPVRSYNDPESFADLVRRDLLALFDRFYPPVHHSSIEAERRAHQEFAAMRRRAYVEQPGLMERLDNAVESDGPPMVVTGPTGSGKSALLANWSMRYRLDHPDAFIVEYYAGARTTAPTASMLLRQVMEEIGGHYGISDVLPVTNAGLREAFPYWLLYGRSERMIVIIDALDQIDLPANDLTWLPDYLPPHVRLIVSTLHGEIFDALLDRGWQVLELPPLNATMRRHLIESFLDQMAPPLLDRPTSYATMEQAGSTPLSLRVALEELSLHTSAEDPSSIDRLMQAGTAGELFDLVLERLEKSRGEELVRDTLSLLWASRSGLSVGELQELGAIEHSKLAPLLLDLDHYLVVGMGLLSFFHDGLRRAVEHRYALRDGVARGMHRRLARYFARGPLAQRRLHEEPWQLMQAHAWADLKRCVTNPDIFRGLSSEQYHYELLQYWLALEKNFDLEREYSEMRERLDIPLEKYASTLEQLGYFLTTVGRFDSAIRVLTEALDVRRNLEGELGRSYATAAQHLATAYYYRGEYKPAESLLRKAIGIWEKLEGPNSEGRLRAINDLGAILYGGGRHAEAAETLGRGLVETENSFRPDHPLILDYLNNLGAICESLGQRERAISLLERIITIKRKCFDSDNPEIAMNIGNLAILLQRNKEFGRAESLFREALEILTACFGRNHPATTKAIINLGSLMRDMKRFGEGEELLTEALAIRERLFGPHHETAVDALSGLTDLMIESGQYERAEAHFAKLTPLRLSLYGKDHPKVRIVEQRYNDLQELKRSRNDSTS